MGLLLGLFCYQKLSIFEEKLCVFVNCIGNSADPILDLTTRNDFSWNCFLQEIAFLISSWQLSWLRERKYTLSTADKSLSL